MARTKLEWAIKVPDQVPQLGARGGRALQAFSLTRPEPQRTSEEESTSHTIHKTRLRAVHFYLYTIGTERVSTPLARLVRTSKGVPIESQIARHHAFMVALQKSATSSGLRMGRTQLVVLPSPRRINATQAFAARKP